MSDNLSDEDYQPSSHSDDDDLKKTKSKSTNGEKSKYNRIAFSSTDEERLIELIKSKEYMYNVSHSDYKDRLKKNKAWEEIAKTLSKSVEDCKKKWKNIKDQFDRTKKKQPTGSGASSSQNKRNESLSFLDVCPTSNIKYDMNMKSNLKFFSMTESLHRLNRLH